MWGSSGWCGFVGNKWGCPFEGNVVPLFRSTTGWGHVGHPSPRIQKLGEDERNLPIWKKWMFAFVKGCLKICPTNEKLNCIPPHNRGSLEGHWGMACHVH